MKSKDESSASEVDDGNNETPIEESQQSRSDTKREKQKKVKSTKKQKKKDLRTKNLGLGLKISIDNSEPNKKIVFNESDDENVKIDINNDDQSIEIIEQKTEVESDDEVEEVKALDAKAQAQLQRNTERQSRALSSQNTHKLKRKRAQPISDEDGESSDGSGTSNSDDDSDSNSDEDQEDMEDEKDNFLTEDFFSQVDSERERNRLKKKVLKKSLSKVNIDTGKSNLYQGKHTTFVTEDSDPVKSRKDIVTDNTNLEVIVLEGNKGQSSFKDRKGLVLSAQLGTKPSKVALNLSRTKVHASGTLCTNKSNLPANKQWTRSKKMKYTRRTGRPAPVFTIINN